MACEDNVVSGVACVIDDIGSGVGDLINGAAGLVSFAQDPFGATLQALKDGAHSLAADVLPALSTAVQPDLSADFFINAYRISFAGAIFLMVIILISLFVKTAKGQLAGRDLVQSLAQYAPVFIIGTMFGPMLGMIIVGVFHALTNSLIGWGLEGQATKVIDWVLGLIDKVDPAALPGGVLLAILLMFLMLIGLLIVLVILIGQLVTLYFTGVIAPLAVVWVIDPERRQFGMKMIGLWIGILAAHPVLIFLLGFAFSIMSDSIVTLGEKDGLQTIVTFIVALIALYMAAFSPMLLMKFAPIIPQMFAQPSAPAGGGVPTFGHANTTDATNAYGSGGNESSHSTSTTSTSTDARTSQDTSSTSTEDTSLTRASESADSAVPEAVVTKAGGGSPAVGETSLAGTESSAGAAGGASELAAAGAAESSTGVGAAVGVPTLIAAAGVAAAEKAKSGADAMVAQTVAPMDDSTVGGGSL